MALNVIAWMILCVLWAAAAGVAVYEWHKWYDSFCVMRDMNERMVKYYTEKMGELEKRVSDLSDQFDNSEDDGK